LLKKHTLQEIKRLRREFLCSSFELTEKQRQRRDNLCSNKMVCNPIKVQRTEKLNIHHQKKYIYYSGATHLMLNYSFIMLQIFGCAAPISTKSSKPLFTATVLRYQLLQKHIPQEVKRQRRELFGAAVST
jgi:hypothetical protein